MSTILNLTEAKAKYSEIFERLSRGEEIIVTRIGYPVACSSTRYEPGVANRRLRPLEGRIRIAEDFDIWP
jgi:antitoxin (DNA-binding transcriptional repressor) of toxin-antitoxin stability system